KAVHEPLCDTTIAHPCLVPRHQGTTKEPRNGKSRRLPETTIFQDAPKKKAFSSAGKREKLQEERDSETVDQEVGGSSPPSCTKPLRRLRPWRFPVSRRTRGNEARRRLEHVCVAAEGVQRGLRVGNQRFQPAPRGRGSQHADQRCLVSGRVLAGRLAHRCRIAFDVQEIVGDLERLAEG